MAIKVIREGQKTFTAFCERCGCEFTYELSDLKLSHADRVACPCCGQDHYHKPLAKTVNEPYSPKDLTWPPEPIPCTPDMTKTDPCAGCAWRGNLLRDGIYVGDTPCTWCNKNKFNNIAEFKQNSILKACTLQSVPTVEVHLADKCNCGDNAVCSKCSGSSGVTTVSNTTSNDTATKAEVKCMCEGDIWNTCGCRFDNTDCSATKTAVEAAQASCNHTLKELCGSIKANQ